MISRRLLNLVRCPECRMPVAGRNSGTAVLACVGCGREYRNPGAFLDMRPAEPFAERTKYLDEALHADARHERVSPPLLGSKIRNDMLRRFLQPSSRDRVVDLGCGSGRALLWNRDWGAAAVGVDIAPFFSEEARGGVDLLLADLRRLPFPDRAFTRAYSLDVLEHLSPDALRDVLSEANRVLEPGGTFFVYTHVRKNAPIAKGLRWINAAARQLERAGLIDMRQERLRKSDHVNPLRDIPELQQFVTNAGFRIARITYYTPIVGGFVENILVRVVERAMTRRAARRRASTSGVPEDERAAVRETRLSAKERISSRGPMYAALRAASAAMTLDVLLFGRIQSGPFFALLEKIRDRSPAAP